MVNSYSPVWFDLFLETQPYTAAEVTFLERQLPDPPYHRILDVACGPARHAQHLVQSGYEIVGIDLNEQALAKARQVTSGRATFIQQDMRRLAEVPGTFDGIICLWQSFGYFTAETNQDILQQMSAKLNRPGRLILDIYHRAFFENNQGTRQLERRGKMITITESMQDDRLTAEIDYGNASGRETFSWLLYTPEEMIALAAPLGLRCELVCTHFDEQNPAGVNQLRVQIVLEKN